MNREFREALIAGEPVVGNWISLAHPAIAETSADLGFDFVVIDTEHTSIGVDELESMIRATDAGDGATAPIVRIPDHDAGKIKRVLDAGAAGLMVPMVESAEEAERVVEAVRYPPEGRRGAAPARASGYGRSFGEYFEGANEGLVTIVQIETARAVENIEEGVAVDGGDAGEVGPGDLSASLGVFGEWDHDAFRDALDRVVEAAADAGVPVGMLALDEEGIDRWLDAGVDFMAVGVDVVYLQQGAESAKEHFEDAVEE